MFSGCIKGNIGQKYVNLIDFIENIVYDRDLLHKKNKIAEITGAKFGQM